MARNTMSQVILMDDDEFARLRFDGPDEANSGARGIHTKYKEPEEARSCAMALFTVNVLYFLVWSIFVALWELAVFIWLDIEYSEKLPLGYYFAWLTPLWFWDAETLRIIVSITLQELAIIEISHLHDWDVIRDNDRKERTPTKTDVARTKRVLAQHEYNKKRQLIIFATTIVILAAFIAGQVLIALLLHDADSIPLWSLMLVAVAIFAGFGLLYIVGTVSSMHMKYQWTLHTTNELRTHHIV